MTKNLLLYTGFVAFCMFAEAAGTERSTGDTQQTITNPSDAQQVLQRMLAVPIATPGSVLALGYKGLEADTLRNWHLLARKLSTEGANVTVVTYGGSLTAGYLAGNEGSWVEQLVVWLKAAFPSVNVNVMNLARGASDVVVAATCWYQYMPQETDLVLVEYSLNGCRGRSSKPMCSTITMPRVASYESLYRRVIRRAPSAALMSVAMFSFSTYLTPTIDNTTAQMLLPNPFHNSGEELHSMIARRYGAPTASLRNSLYDLLYDDSSALRLLGATRSTLMADYIHPTAAGFKVYGDVVSYAVRQTLAAVFANGANDPSNDALIASGGLPASISPVAAQQDTDVWCTEGSNFKAAASCIGKPSSCQWRTSSFNVKCPHLNCRMRGYYTKGQGQMLHINVDTSMLSGARTITARAGNSSEADPWAGNNSFTGVSTGPTDRFVRRYLAVTYLQSNIMPAERMGVAHLACVQGCRCRRVQLAFRGEVSTGIAATEVTAHPQCVAHITIQPNPTTGGDEFAVTGVAVIPFSTAAPVSPIDHADMNAGRADGNQLPVSWP